MKRSYYTNRYEGQVEDPRVDAFIADVLAVCREHGMGISHEDSQGGFEIVPLEAADDSWFEAASSHVPLPAGVPIYDWDGSIKKVTT